MEPVGGDFEAAIHLLEQEEEAFAASNGKSRRPFTDLVSTKTDFRVPWLFNDFNPKTATDDALLLSATKAIAGIKGRIAATGAREETPAFRRQLAADLVAWIMSPKGLDAKTVTSWQDYDSVVRFMTLPRKKLIPVLKGEQSLREPAGTEDTLLELLGRPSKERYGDCSMLARVAYAVFRLAGLDPTFIDVQRDRFDPTITEHAAVGFAPDPSQPGKLLTVDLYHDGWVSEEGHPLQSAISAVSALAVYLNDRAIDLALAKGTRHPSELDHIDRIFQLALAYDPSYALIRSNYDIFLNHYRRKPAGKPAKK